MKIHPISRSELWLAQCALVVAILLQIVSWKLSPAVAYEPQGFIILTEIVLLIIISFSASARNLRPNFIYRDFSIILLGVISLANIYSFLSIVQLLLTDGVTLSGRELITSAIAIFLTNVIVFALWYWEIDSPGLSGRKWTKSSNSFQFTEQNLAERLPDWQPRFIDYLYLSVTNSINFAPADAKPITSHGKVLMGSQALISVFTLALILARSVNVLG